MNDYCICVNGHIHDPIEFSPDGECPTCGSDETEEFQAELDGMVLDMLEDRQRLIGEIGSLRKQLKVRVAA